MTLARFIDQAAIFRSEVFVQRVTPDKHDEYYYVVVLGTEEVHNHLRSMGFNNSYVLAGQAMGDGNGR